MLLEASRQSIKKNHERKVDGERKKRVFVLEN